MKAYLQISEDTLIENASAVQNIPTITNTVESSHVRKKRKISRREFVDTDSNKCFHHLRRRRKKKKLFPQTTITSSDAQKTQ